MAVKSISQDHKIQLISHLVTMLAAGITPQDAIVKVKQSDPSFDPYLKPVLSHLQSGRALSSSLGKTDLFNRFDLAFLSIYENAGLIIEGLRDIQRRLEKRYKIIHKLKTKLYLATGILVVAILASTGIIVARVSPEAGLLHIAQNTGLLLIILWLINFISIQVKDSTEIAFKLYWRYKNVRDINLIRNIVEIQWYKCLINQMKSGIDIRQSIHRQRNLCDVSSYLDAIDQCEKQIASGTALTPALVSSGLVFSTLLRQNLMVAEQSGSLDTGLEHHLMLVESELEGLLDAYVTWIPRFYYMFMVLLGSSLIS